RGRALELIGAHCREMDGFLATCAASADFMAECLAIRRQRIDVVYPGLNVKGHGGRQPERDGAPFTIGYFARICPEKGLHVLVDAYRILRRAVGAAPCRLRLSGSLGEHQRHYLEELRGRLRADPTDRSFAHIEPPDPAA